MKKIYCIFILLFFLCNIAAKAPKLSCSDSVIYYLKQVKGLQHNDSVLLEKAVASIYISPSDSLPVDKIESEVKKLLPVIQRQNFLAVKIAVSNVLSNGNDLNRSI